MQFKSLKINEIEMHFLIVHGCPLPPLPPSYSFFRNLPPKPMAPHGDPPPLKNEAPPHLKNNLPHWNMKDPSMKWFLEKAQ